MDPNVHPFRIHEILQWRLSTTQGSKIEVDLLKFLTHLLLFEKDKNTDKLRQMLLEEFETVWGQLLVEKRRELTLKNMFSKAWRRVEGRLR